MPEQAPKDEHVIAGVRDIVREAVAEFVQSEQRKTEPAYQAELQDERRRRENLEAKLNQVVEENRRAQAAAEEADRHAQIRAELQRIGIAKVDLAFRAMKDEIVRSEDGRLQSKGPEAKTLQEYAAAFIQENPELLPARIAGGSGAQSPNRSSYLSEETHTVSLDNIRPGMAAEEFDRVRQHIAKLAWQALRGA